MPPDQPPPGDFLLRTRDSGGSVLQEASFEPSRPVAGGDFGFFLISLPKNPAVASAEILKAGVVLTSTAASANPPAVQVTFPNGGESLADDAVDLQWTAGDPDGDALTYTVQFSRDSGATWQTLAIDWPGKSMSVGLGELGQTAAGLLRIKVSDGFRVTEDISDAVFSVANSRPRVSITSSGGVAVFTGQRMFVDSLTFDVEDGQLSGGSLVWRSDRDGVIGTGETLEVEASALSDGDHVISVTATDSAGASSTTSTPMFINPVADMQVTQSVPTSVPVTLEFTYSMTVANRGPNGTSGTLLTQVLSSSSPFVSSSSSQGECSHSNGTVECRIGVLRAGESATVEVTATATGLSPLESFATVVSDGGDPDVSNNVAQTETTPALVPGIPSAQVWGILLLALLFVTIVARRRRSEAALYPPTG